MFYSQRDKKWGGDKMNNTESRLKDFGCLVTALAQMSGMTPRKANQLLTDKGGYTRDLVLHKRAAELLGLEYHGFAKKDTKVSYITIAEVDFSPRNGKQQHFVIWLPDDNIIDPWTGRVEPKTKYPLISFRLYKSNTFSLQEPMNETKEEPKETGGIKKHEGEWIAKMGGKKFVLTLVVIAAMTFLLQQGSITPEQYQQGLLFALGIYSGANIGQKIFKK